MLNTQNSFIPDENSRAGILPRYLHETVFPARLIYQNCVRQAGAVLTHFAKCNIWIGRVYSAFDLHNVYEGVISTDKQQADNELHNSKEIQVTIHHTDNGPSLESCMISILSSHISKTANF